MKRKALLMIELLIAMLIIAVTAGAFSLSSDIWTLTAKREAEKLAAKINNLKLKADATKTHFQLSMPQGNQTRLTVQWNSSHTSIIYEHNDFIEYIDADKGCSYSWETRSDETATHRNDTVYYSYITNMMTPGATIAVRGRGSTYYVIIASIGGRVRVSDKKPSKDL